MDPLPISSIALSKLELVKRKTSINITQFLFPFLSFDPRKITLLTLFSRRWIVSFLFLSETIRTKKVKDNNPSVSAGVKRDTYVMDEVRLLSSVFSGKDREKKSEASGRKKRRMKCRWVDRSSRSSFSGTRNCDRGRPGTSCIRYSRAPFETEVSVWKWNGGVAVHRTLRVASKKNLINIIKSLYHLSSYSRISLYYIL